MACTCFSQDATVKCAHTTHEDDFVINIVDDQKRTMSSRLTIPSCGNSQPTNPMRRSWNRTGRRR